jgi:hypothetical protein
VVQGADAGGWLKQAVEAIMQVLLPLVGAAAAAGAAYLVSPNLWMAIAIGIATGVGVWLGLKRQAPRE